MKQFSFFHQSRLPFLCSLLFLCFLSSGLGSSKKPEGRAFPFPGTFNEVWTVTLESLEEEGIPLHISDKENGYIQSKTFSLYKEEYKKWAKAPLFFSQGFSMVEIGITSGESGLTVVGIKAYFKRKHSTPLSRFRKNDPSRGVFEGLLAGRINDRLVKKKYPKLKHVILGCNLRFNEKKDRYVVVEAAPTQLAHEQGLRNGDILIQIDGEEVHARNLFHFFLDVKRETVKSFLVEREEEKLKLPISIFYLDPKAPRLGMLVIRDLETKKFQITHIQKNSLAEKGGLKTGDFLLKQNGVSLDGWRPYYRALLAQKPGEIQTFEIERRGIILQKKAKLP